MSGVEQLQLSIEPSCKYRCPRPVVGSSTTGDGHVCKHHNEMEWGKALVRSKYWPEMGAALITDAKKRLAA